jgi:hypothetical protein
MRRGIRVGAALLLAVIVAAVTLSATSGDALLTVAALLFVTGLPWSVVAVIALLSNAPIGLVLAIAATCAAANVRLVVAGARRARDAGAPHP